MSKTKQVKEVTVDFDAIQAAFIDAIQERKARRIAELEGTGKKCTTINADLSEAQNTRFKIQLEHVVKNGFATADALHGIASTIKTGAGDDYVAIKVITKIRQCIYALATKQKRELDQYTNSILFNLSKNQELSMKDGLKCLSKAIEYDELDQVAHVRAIIDCGVNTATTQLSSSRQMLRFLNVCNVQKNKRGDVISFKDNAQAHAIIAFYQS